MFKRLVQLFFLLVLVAVAGLVWFSWYASTPLLVPVGAAESSVPASGESMIMEPVEARFRRRYGDFRLSGAPPPGPAR